MTASSELVDLLSGRHAPLGAARPELRAVGDLTQALRALDDMAGSNATVEVQGPASAELRAFLRSHGRRSGGWLNRSWSLSADEVAELAHLAEASRPATARVFAVEGAGDDPESPRRVRIAVRDPRAMPALRPTLSA